MRKILKITLATTAFAGFVIVWLLAGTHEFLAPVDDAESRQTSAQDIDENPTIPTDTISRLIPPASPTSNHPVERAVANGIVLDSRIQKAGEPNQWTLTRLVSSNAQPRPVRVVEQWLIDPVTQNGTCLNREMFLADQLIIRVASETSDILLGKKISPEGMRIDSKIADKTFTVRLSKSDIDALPTALYFIKSLSDLVVSVEPDGVGFGGGTPNDSQYSSQWGLHNTGQTSGTIDTDIDAPEFWDIMVTTPGIVIAVLDSGLNFTHPDLQNIAWINPNEVSGDGIDNDSSGRVDDINGWDFVNNDNSATDDHGHGSNVTGIIAASRDNGIGIAGMVSGVKILVCKVLNSNNSGLTSDLIAATTYARLRGVPVMNLSLQSYPFSNALNAEFSTCESAGILLCICAGNQGTNNDTTPNYPSSHPQTNIISVGNHDRTDVRWSGSFNPSNYGSVSVDLFAPGREIVSPILGVAYSSYTGTSQAAPFVTAICAAIKYSNPSWTASQIKSCVMNSVVTRASYSGLCITGGRLNAVDAISRACRHLPTQDSDADQFSNLFEYLAGSRIDTPTSRPLVSTTTTGGYLKIGVGQVTRPDGHFEIETSTNLTSWRTTGITDFSSPSALLGGIPLSSEPKAFLRIKAVPSP